jgi:hypothetical protein
MYVGVEITEDIKMMIRWIFVGALLLSTSTLLLITQMTLFIIFVYKCMYSVSKYWWFLTWNRQSITHAQAFAVIYF